MRARMLSYQLGQIEKMISSQLGNEGNIFIRIGKSLIINRSYIYYLNIPKQKLILSDVASFNHTVTASKEALKQLKELLEKGGKIMMKELKEIRDDQIRIIGEGGSKNSLPRNVWIILLSILGIAVIGVIILLCSDHKEEEVIELKQPEPALFEPVRLLSLLNLNG